MNKIWIVLGVVVVLLSAAAMGLYFWSTAQLERQANCGDGICGPIEKQRGLCPQDCGSAPKSTVITQPTQNQTNNNTSRPNATKPARIYVSFVSHNEDSINRGAAGICYSVTETQDGYLANRDLLILMAKIIREHQGAWDIQSDWTYLKAIEKWDTTTVKSNTSGKNILKYLAETDLNHISVDAHAHEVIHQNGTPQYNYADVAYLSQNLGLIDAGVVGGFAYTPSSQEVWTRFQNPLFGNVYSNFSWSPKILWGAASAAKNHQGEEHASGIWRPKDPQHFFEDDPNKTLVNIGDGGNISANVTKLLEKLKNGELENGHMYTVTIGFNQCEMTTSMIQTYADLIDSLKSDVAAGSLVWAPLPKMLNDWKNIYNEAPTVVLMSSLK